MYRRLSVFGYLGMVGGLVGLLATRGLFSRSPLVISAQVAAFLLLVWARFTFGGRSFHLAANPTEGGLVTSGPYRYIRHPIYSSICVLSLAGVAAHGTWAGLFFGGLVLGGALIRITCEEALLAARYPEYVEYKSLTWRMIPYAY